jgi:hypothetical protein
MNLRILIRADVDQDLRVWNAGGADAGVASGCPATDQGQAPSPIRIRRFAVPNCRIDVVHAVLGASGQALEIAITP